MHVRMYARMHAFMDVFMCVCIHAVDMQALYLYVAGTCTPNTPPVLHTSMRPRNHTAPHNTHETTTTKSQSLT